MEPPSTPMPGRKPTGKRRRLISSTSSFPKGRRPKQNGNLKMATDYANAEESLIESHLNSNVDSKYSPIVEGIRDGQ